MAKSNSVTRRGSAIWSLIVFSGLVGLFGFFLPGRTYAAPPTPAGAEKCAECHPQETEAWQNSVHAHAVAEDGALGATCEACHGTYVADHPEAGVMQLTVDSSVCEDCHTTTFTQWKESIHAQSGVQCIGCHLSHSQEFRLSDNDLCSSCHRDRLDTAHGKADIDCIECHSSTAAHEVTLVSTSEADGRIPVSSHDFTSVLSEDCVNCHGVDIHVEDAARISQVASLTAPECEPALVAKLETAQQTNKSLQTMAPVSLGLGMGIGGMLGIIFMLVVGYTCQGRIRQ